MSLLLPNTCTHKIMTDYDWKTPNADTAGIANPINTRI